MRAGLDGESACRAIMAHAMDPASRRESSASERRGSLFCLTGYCCLFGLINSPRVILNEGGEARFAIVVALLHKGAPSIGY